MRQLSESKQVRVRPVPEFEVTRNPDMYNTGENMGYKGIGYIKNKMWGNEIRVPNLSSKTPYFDINDKC